MLSSKEFSLIKLCINHRLTHIQEIKDGRRIIRDAKAGFLKNVMIRSVFRGNLNIASVCKIVEKRLNIRMGEERKAVAQIFSSID